MRLRVTTAIPESAGPQEPGAGLPLVPRFLLLERSPTDKRHPGLWEFPGGNPEHDEPIEEAAVREAEEETHLTIRAVHGLGTWARDKETSTAFFLATLWDGTITVSYEHSSFRWATLHEILNHPDEPVGIDTIECAKRLQAERPLC